MFSAFSFSIADFASGVPVSFRMILSDFTVRSIEPFSVRFAAAASSFRKSFETGESFGIFRVVSGKSRLKLTFFRASSGA